MIAFPLVKLYNLENSTSDRSPLFLDFGIVHKEVHRQHFRFENYWLREPLCFQIIKDVWSKNFGLIIKDKVAKCGVALSEWSQVYAGNFKNRLQECKMELDR